MSIVTQSFGTDPVAGRAEGGSGDRSAVGADEPTVVVTPTGSTGSAGPLGEHGDHGDHADGEPPARGRLAVRLLIAGIWTGVILLCGLVVIYGLEPLFQQREQRLLLDSYTAQISKAANEAGGLPGVEAVTAVVPEGAPVGIVEIGSVQTRQVVVEGSLAPQTQVGPGHVAGTAGLGQPGNSVVVGRRTAFGGSFGNVPNAKVGDDIVVTTTQGQSIYRVETIGQPRIADAPGPGAVMAASLLQSAGDNRLTLVTSATANPLNASEAVVVVAIMQGEPFAPTPQAPAEVSLARFGGGSGSAGVLLVGVGAIVVGVVAALWFRRRTSLRSTYLVAVPPLAALTIVVSELVSHLFPGWA